MPNLKKNKNFNVKMDIETLERFKVACEREGYKYSYVITKLMRAFVKKYHPDLLNK